MFGISRTRIAFLLSLVLVVVGCVTLDTFHGRWWNYYERGLTYLEQDQFDQAANDFQAALSGQSSDAWSARTYGLHFVEYFPNRELGIAYFHQGRLDEAEEALQRSLEYVDTERAHYYIDQIKKERLAQGTVDDTAPPAVNAALGGAAYADAAVTSSRTVPVTLRGEDDFGVETVRLNGERLYQRGSAEEVLFEDTLQLSEGTHALELQAVDLAGKETTNTVNIRVDLTGPAIGIIEPSLPLVTQADAVVLRGGAADAGGVANIKLDGQALAEAQVGAGEQLRFETRLPLQPGGNSFVLTAADLAGNETAMAVSVYRGNPASTAARVWKIEQRLGHPIALASTDWHGPMLSVILAQEEQAAAEAAAEPIQIQMKFPHGQTETDPYRKAELRLAGRVEAAQPLSSIRVQGEDYPVVPEATQMEFSRRIPIEQGANEVQVQAQDAAGNADDWSATVVGQPVVLDEYKLKVAVQHFENAQPDIETYLRSILESSLRSATNERFEVLDRAALEDVLLEQQLAASDLADPRFSTRLGRIKPADVFLYASVFDRGNGGYEILTKAISTETALVLADFDTFIENWSDEAERRFKVDAIAAWLAETFPRLPGSVIRVAGQDAWIDLGSEEGVKKGMKVVVTYEVFPAEVDEATGEVLEEAIYDALGWASIAGAQETRSKLDPVQPTGEGNEAAQPQEGQPVFTM